MKLKEYTDDAITMHVISRKKLREFWQQHDDATLQLAAWFKVAESAQWTQWADVTHTYPKASYFHCCLVFNICGGQYRLVVRRSANWKTLFIVGVMSHSEYDRNSWKEFCTCH
jgi:mRNA interferase HigB